MLKLSQITITEANTLIAEILEPVVYTHAGSVVKTDEIISKEKATMHFLLAKVVKEPNKLLTTSAIASCNSDEAKVEVIYKKDDIILIPRHALEPIQFPIEGYDSPKLSFINIYNIKSIITEE